MKTNQKRYDRIDLPNNIPEPPAVLRDEENDQLIIQVLAGEATEVQLKRAYEECLSYAVTLVRRGKSVTAHKWISTARELEQRLLNVSDSPAPGVMWR
jgi:predicted nucleic acid-binding Zn finger protein